MFLKTTVLLQGLSFVALGKTGTMGGKQEEGALSLPHTTKLCSALQADPESKIKREKAIILLFSRTAWGLGSFIWAMMSKIPIQP